MKKTLLLIRHGETAKNITGKIHLLNDVTPLNSLGEKQMHDVANFLADKPIDQIYCSDTLRTEQSADIICAKLNLEKIVITEVHERSWGELEETPWVEIENMLGKMNIEERYKFKPKGGESWKDVEERAGRKIKQILSNGQKYVGIITHGGIIRAVIPSLLRSSKNAGITEISNGSISTFVFEEDKLIYSDINNTKHLSI